MRTKVKFLVISNYFLAVGFKFPSGSYAGTTVPWSVSLSPLWSLIHAQLNGNFLPESPDLVAINEEEEMGQLSEPLYKRHRVGKAPPWGDRKWVPCSLPLLLLGRNQMVRTCTLQREEKRQALSVHFPTKWLSALKWHFQALLSRGSQTRLEAANINSSIQLPPTDQCLFIDAHQCPRS